MCRECGHIVGHDGRCPMNPVYNEPQMVTCPICDVNYSEDSMEYPVCFYCLFKNMTFETAEQYGSERNVDVKINALWAKLFTPSMINEVLREKAIEYKILFPYMLREDVQNFFADDTRDFADWLVERKEKHG